MIDKFEEKSSTLQSDIEIVDEILPEEFVNEKIKTLIEKSFMNFM